MLDTIDLDPAMFRPFEPRLDRGREIRVRDRADGDADHSRQIVGLPIDRRAAVGAEIEADLAAAFGGTNVFPWRTGDRHDFNRIERADTEWRAGSSLTVDAVTGNDQRGRPGKRKRDSATTASGIDHREALLIGRSVSELQRGARNGRRKKAGETYANRQFADVGNLR